VETFSHIHSFENILLEKAILHFFQEDKRILKSIMSKKKKTVLWWHKHKGTILAIVGAIISAVIAAIITKSAS